MPTTRFWTIETLEVRGYGRRRAESLGRGSDLAPVLDSLFAHGFFVLQPVDVDDDS